MADRAVLDPGVDHGRNDLRRQLLRPQRPLLLTAAGFNSAVDNPPLHGVANGTSANGLYNYSATNSFPTNTSTATTTGLTCCSSRPREVTDARQQATDTFEARAVDDHRRRQRDCASALAGCGGSSQLVVDCRPSASGPHADTHATTASQSNADIGTAQAQRPVARQVGQPDRQGHKHSQPLGRPPARTPARSVPPARFTRRDPTRIRDRREPDSLKAAQPMQAGQHVRGADDHRRHDQREHRGPARTHLHLSAERSKSEITLAVEDVKLLQVSHQLTKRSQV